jgi:DNA-binding NtrC family response regulator
MSDAETKPRSKENVADFRGEAWPAGRAVQAVGDLGPAMDFSLRSFRNEAEINAISHALQQTGWNRKRAARLLAISYRSLLYKIRRHNIAPDVEQS